LTSTAEASRSAKQVTTERDCGRVDFRSRKDVGDVFQQAVTDGERAERAQQGVDGAADAASVGCGSGGLDIGRRCKCDCRTKVGDIYLVKVK